MSHLARGLNTIQVVGAGPQDAIGVALREAFENVLFVPGKALPSQKSDLVIGLSSRTDDGLQSLIKWANDAEVPALCVDIRDDAALIGPLTLSGRAGCGRCAFARLTAAAATREDDTS